MENDYRTMALESSDGLELVIALYDGLIRFFSQAAECCEAGDVIERRNAVGRALDILIYLQARLRPDAGPRPAEALAEFYASTFALALTASQRASAAEFRHLIGCVQTVRDAWRLASLDGAGKPAQRDSTKRRSTLPDAAPQLTHQTASDTGYPAPRWSA